MPSGPLMSVPGSTADVSGFPGVCVGSHSCACGQRCRAPELRQPVSPALRAAAAARVPRAPATATLRALTPGTTAEKVPELKPAGVSCAGSAECCSIVLMMTVRPQDQRTLLPGIWGLRVPDFFPRSHLDSGSQQFVSLLPCTFPVGLPGRRETLDPFKCIFCF